MITSHWTSLSSLLPPLESWLSPIPLRPPPQLCWSSPRTAWASYLLLEHLASTISKICTSLFCISGLASVCHTLHWPWQTTRPFLNILPFLPPTIDFASPNGGLQPKVNYRMFIFMLMLMYLTVHELRSPISSLAMSLRFFCPTLTVLWAWDRWKL